ncbi:hypothetical protein HK098_007008, partial [Nowakowskiella sp. JEL0407]
MQTDNDDGNLLYSVIRAASIYPLGVVDRDTAHKHAFKYPDSSDEENLPQNQTKQRQRRIRLMETLTTILPVEENMVVSLYYNFKEDGLLYITCNSSDNLGKLTEFVREIVTALQNAPSKNPSQDEKDKWVMMMLDLFLKYCECKMKKRIRDTFRKSADYVKSDPLIADKFIQDFIADIDPDNNRSTIFKCAAARDFIKAWEIKGSEDKTNYGLQGVFRRRALKIAAYCELPFLLLKLLGTDQHSGLLRNLGMNKIRVEKKKAVEVRTLPWKITVEKFGEILETPLEAQKFLAWFNEETEDSRHADRIKDMNEKRMICPDVHAELFLINRLISEGVIKPNSKHMIFVSKLCCHLCSHYITEVVQNKLHIEIKIPGTHGKIYPTWALPEITDKTVEKNEMMECLKKVMQGNFAKFAEGRHSSDTNSMISTSSVEGISSLKEWIQSQ